MGRDGIGTMRWPGVAEIKCPRLKAQPNEFSYPSPNLNWAGDLAEEIGVIGVSIPCPKKDSKTAGPETLHDRLDLAALQKSR